jgi:hypothetical protein
MGSNLSANKIQNYEKFLKYEKTWLGRGGAILRLDFFWPFLKSSIKEYPGKITPSSQIQTLVTLWAVVVNRERPPPGSGWPF